MSLTAGTRLGPYEVLAPIGAGGMGEVYRAKDTRLDRTVAIKVLPSTLASDPQFLERFEREAKSISALNHPNICTLYDVGEAPGAGPQAPATHFLVMEYLEGETLADRLTKGPLPLPEALRIATEIAGALDKAHRQGIVHRDLKPGNVFLVRSGGSAPPAAKLLDFGLAKVGPAGALSGAGATALPTAMAPLTAHGTILGTFQYMAPEQIEGEDADARTDIFAFGAVLFEMLTGRKAFQGKSQASLMSAILKDEPPPVSQVQPVTPPALDHVVRTCLAKDPDNRFQTAHDLLLQVKWIAEGGSAAGVPALVVARRRSRERLAWLTSAVLGVALVGVAAVAIVHLREKPPVAEPVQFNVPLPENAVFGGSSPQFALSPDGRYVVFVAIAQGAPRLWLRPLASLSAQPIAGTEGASYPFWAPDSRAIAFFSNGKLKKVPLTGGPPIALCDAAAGRGGTWNQDDVILFAPSTGGQLQRVAAAGGTPTAATTLDAARHESSHRWPFFLPDGRHFLFISGSPGGQLMLGALGSKETAMVGASDSSATYTSGYLVFARGGSLVAQRFNPETRQAAADTIPVVDQIGVDVVGFSAFSASTTGVVAWVRGNALATSRLTWLDRTGKTLGTVGDPGQYFNVTISPDERHVAASLQPVSTNNRDIYVVDLARAVPSRFTFDPGQDSIPIWSPDGSQIMFNSNRNGPWNIYQKAANLSGQDQLVLKSDATNFVTDWSRDGRFIVYTNQAGATGYDLWMLPLSGDRKPIVFLQTPFNEDNGTFSPDGRWIAYSSTESSREEVYVRPFPATGGQHQISNGGGSQPMWRGDGKELFFVAPDGTLTVTGIDATKDFQAAVPQKLFRIGIPGSFRHSYAVSRDGRRFLVPVPDQQSSPAPITVVVNWPATVAK